MDNLETELKKSKQLCELLNYYLLEDNDTINENNDFYRRAKRIKYWKIMEEKNLIEKYLQNPKENLNKLEIINQFHSGLLKNWEKAKSQIELEVNAKLKSPKNVSSKDTLRTKTTKNKMHECIENAKNFSEPLGSDDIIDAIHFKIASQICSEDNDKKTEILSQSQIVLYQDIEKDINEKQYLFSSCIEKGIKKFIQSILQEYSKSQKHMGNTLLYEIDFDKLEKTLKQNQYKVNLALGLTLNLEQTYDNTNLTKKNLLEELSLSPINIIHILEYFITNPRNRLPIFSNDESNLILINLLTSEAQDIEEIYTISVIKYFLLSGNKEYAELWLLANIFSEISYDKWIKELISETKQRNLFETEKKSLGFLLINCIYTYIFSPTFLEYTMNRWLVNAVDENIYIDLQGVDVEFLKNSNKDAINICLKRTKLKNSKIKKNQYNIAYTLQNYVWKNMINLQNHEKRSAKYAFDRMNCYRNEKKSSEFIETYNILTGFEICVELLNGLDGICLSTDGWNNYMTELRLLIQQLSRYIKVFGRHTIYLVYQIFNIIKIYYKRPDLASNKNDKGTKLTILKAPDEIQEVFRIISEILCKIDIEQITTNIFAYMIENMELLEISDDKRNQILKKTLIKYKVKDRYKKLQKKGNYKTLQTHIAFKKMKNTLSKQDLSTSLEEDKLKPLSTVKEDWYCVLQKLFVEELNRN